MQQLTPAPFTPGMRKTQPAAVNRSHRRVPGIERPKRACIIPTLRQRWGEVVVVHRDEQESEEKATRQTRMQRNLKLPERCTERARARKARKRP